MNDQTSKITKEQALAQFNKVSTSTRSIVSKTLGSLSAQGMGKGIKSIKDGVSTDTIKVAIGSSAILSKRIGKGIAGFFQDIKEGYQEEMNKE